MTEPVHPGPPADATAEEIEADIAATRARLAESVDALAEKVDVKAQAQRAVDDTREQVREKVADAREQVLGKVAGGRDKVTATGQQVVARVRRVPRPAQVAAALVPLAVAVISIARRSGRGGDR